MVRFRITFYEYLEIKTVRYVFLIFFALRSAGNAKLVIAESNPSGTVSGAVLNGFSLRSPKGGLLHGFLIVPSV
jgi:hypothetical protein